MVPLLLALLLAGCQRAAADGTLVPFRADASNCVERYYAYNYAASGGTPLTGTQLCQTQSLTLKSNTTTTTCGK